MAVIKDRLRNLGYNTITGKQVVPTEEDVKSAKELADILKGRMMQRR